MQKFWAVIVLLSALASNHEALPQTKWSRPVRNSHGQLTRERRQFPFGDWIPLTQSCPTCRLFADPLDAAAGFRGDGIGLTPPRPPTVTRQIHGEGNFFQDESSILSVPPPPPSIASANGNFQFSAFGQQFNSPLPVPTQKILPQNQQIQFFPTQTFLPNQPLLVNGNQQVLTGLSGQGNLFAQGQSQQQVNGKVTTFQNSDFKTQKLPENVVLDQNKRPPAPKPFSVNKPQPFTAPQQNQQQTFVQQQAFNGQRQHSVNFGNAILTPPPAPNNTSQDVLIPGLDKEEIQLLYVPVETLRQRGTPQEQLLTQQPQNIQFFNGANSQRPVNNVRPTEQTLVTQAPKGHFVTQNGNSPGQSGPALKVTSAQPFSTSVTPSSLLLQHLPFQQTPQPFVSATPATPTLQSSFVTPASVFQKFSPFTPETTLPHLSTVPNAIQFSQSDLDFGTTPKTISNEGVFQGGIVTGKQEFSGLKGVGFSNEEQGRPLQQTLQQSFVGQQQVVTQPPQQNGVFAQEQQKDIHVQNRFPTQIDQTQVALQKQQETQRLLQQKQRQKELEEQRFIEQQRKQKELEEQRLVQQQRQKELEQQRFAQKQKELEEQRLLQQQRQKELEQQRFLQKQKELEEQRRLEQQRQKELEQQRYLQKQKELEEQRLLQQQQRQKELEQQRFLQQQRQKELEEQRFLQEQRQREQEHQRRLQLQKQKELEEQRLLQQLKQKEEEQQRLLRFQQQQKEQEQQKLLQAQQEQQRRLEQQRQENQQKFQLFKQQHLQKQNAAQQQTNRHVLPDNDKLNFIPQLEKESEEDQQLVPHQPPLSVFFRGYNGAQARITDVLRELRSSNTITVLDQYFEKMPKVFVGPAGLIPPAGYGKFDLPYLSNLESNRIDRRIDRLPFFVAPLNFVPPPGYAKIPFPAPHVGSVVISSETNPAMKLHSIETGSGQVSSEENNSGSYPVVGPELPGLINNLDTVTTTVKPATYVSTPSLPQTTAQLRNRRPNSSLYKPQSRKPITRTRSSTTSKPEEEVTQKTEAPKDAEVRKPFNRFLHRRRQQTKTTTESTVRGQQEGKNLENRHYSVEVYHQEKNQVPGTQLKSEVAQQSQGEQLSQQFEHGSIDRITPGGHGVFEVRPTPEYSRTQQVAGAIGSEERHQDSSDYSDINLQTFEDGPLPTGSAKTITQELYRPNAISQPEGEANYRKISKSDSTPDKFLPASYDEVTTKFPEIPEVSPTPAAERVVSEEHASVPPTSVLDPEKQTASSEGYESTEASHGEVPFTPRPVTVSGEHQTKGFLDSNEQYTSAFAEISKHHHIPGFAEPNRNPPTFGNVYPTPEISLDLQAPLSQEFGTSGEVRPTENSAESSKVLPTGSSQESYLGGFERVQQSDVSSGQVSPTAPGAADSQYNAGVSVDSQAAANPVPVNGYADDERTASFINLHGVSSAENSQQFFPSSTAQPAVTENNPIVVEQNNFSPTSASAAEVTVNPSVQTYTSEGSVQQQNDQTQVTEGHGQDAADNLGSDHRLKLPNPSIVRVRTRVRGKTRGQVNFANSQSTTSAPYTRSDSRHNENPEQELTTKTNSFRDYHPVKTSKYNQFRGVKKPLRTTTEAATTEYEHKANIYTIRPPRRPLSPSTVSTKRIRRPTTPLPSAEAVTEVFGISTGGSYSQSDHSDISPSGVSNDVYYEQSSLSPVKNKFRKHFGSAEQKNDVVPVYSSTAFPSLQPTYSPAVQDGYSEESNVVREVAYTAAPQESQDRYPEWNPSESGFDVSGIVLTTIRAPGQEEDEEVEEPKKALDGKKAFDPDLEKKTGRRRVRVRVHKRPHENFETAESQNLRTVANVLVPPTTTYKPNDESSFHQLAKNADFSFGGQKLFGLRSREYFRKRLNLTEGEGANKGEQQSGSEGGAGEGDAGAKSVGVLKKSQKVELESASGPSNDGSEGGKIARPKFRGFVRKIVKHGGAGKDRESESNQLAETDESESKHGTGEFHSRQQIRLNQGGFNHTGRVNGTKHKTFVRYVKKNKVRPHVETTEAHVESSSQEVQKEEEVSRPTESLSPEIQQATTTESQPIEVVQQEEEEKVVGTHQETQQGENSESQQHQTEEAGVQQPSIQTTQSAVSAETSESSSQEYQASATPSSTPLQGGPYLTQRPKFFQTLRPIYQRTSQSGFYRTRESEAPSSTTEQTVQEPQEKRTGHRYKYGKTTSAAVSTEKTEESKKVSEQQLKNKNLHTLEVRKYLRSKNREGAFSQFSRNRYFSSEKTESETAKHEESSESEEITTERISELPQTETTSTEPKTTQFVRTESPEPEVETAKTESEQPTTTEGVSSSEEESSEEEGDDKTTTSGSLESTTETDVPTTVFRASSTEPVQQASSTETPATETQPDIYRFSKDSFSFDEAEKFTGTKNRAHVRNITTDIIENTASFSAPGVEKRPEIHIVTQRVDEILPAATETSKEKTEATTENIQETTTEYPETETTAAAEAITKAKIAKVLKTSTTTKISHETEICYRGKCIRTKSENPDEDLKQLVDSASTMKIEKRKT